MASGSWTLKADRVWSSPELLLPWCYLLLLMRQWLGWTYVMKRLLSENVDTKNGLVRRPSLGKTPVLAQQGFVGSRHEVRPILGRCRAMAMAAGLILGGASLCQAL